MSLETLTVMFTDIVGSTSMVDRLGEAAAEQIRRRHADDAGSAVEAHGGRVVKSLGDGIMACFSSCAPALEAAVAVQRAASRHLCGTGVRVGVSVGDVEAEARELSGLPVHEAARLCTRSEGGQILISGLVLAMAGRRTEFETTPLGALELRGMAEAVETHEVLWEPLVNIAPLPAMIDVRRRVQFVARRTEQAILDDERALSLAGATRAVLIGGDPGVGKSRLVEAVTSRWHRAGATVLSGRCDRDSSSWCEPVIQAIAHITAHVELSGLADLDPAKAELACSLLRNPYPGRERSGADPVSTQTELFEAVGSVFAAVARESSEGLVLIFEDLHWAAEGTVSLIRHLLEQDATSILILGTYRPQEVGFGSCTSRLRSLVSSGDGPGRRLILAGLSYREVVEFIEAAAGLQLEPDGLALAGYLYGLAGGNPLFVGELLLALVDSGHIRLNDGGYQIATELNELPIPVSIRDAVGQRMARLPQRAQQLLVIASVMGGTIEVGAVAEIGGMGLAEAVEAVEMAETAALLIDRTAQRSTTFTHDVIRRSIYESISNSRRSLLHAQVAELLERRAGQSPTPTERARIAHHWQHSMVGSRTERGLSRQLVTAGGPLQDRVCSDASELDLRTTEAGVADPCALGGLHMRRHPRDRNRAASGVDDPGGATRGSARRVPATVTASK